MTPRKCASKRRASDIYGAMPVKDSVANVAIGLIGAGRLARALAWRLHAVGCRVHAVASRSPVSAAALATSIPNCTPCCAQQVADTCDLVFITTPDAAIQNTVDAIVWRAGNASHTPHTPHMPQTPQAVVHCSGATSVSVLDKAARDGALTGGFHPLQSFAAPEAAVQTLAGCTITLQAQGELLTLLTALAQRLGCAVHVLPAHARATYHAAASFASQHLNVLLAQAVRLWQSWGASEEQALQALLPLARGTLASIQTSGLAQGMPGPVSRGDAQTVQAHLTALREHDASAAALYRELCLQSIPLAVAAGNLQPDQVEKIVRVLHADDGAMPPCVMSRRAHCGDHAP